MAVITVSRSYGLYIEEYLNDFADRNGFDVFSHEILIEVAKDVGQSIDKLKEIYSMDNFSSFKLFLSEILSSMTDASSIMVTGSQIDSPVYFPLFFPTGGEYDNKVKPGGKNRMLN